MSTRFCVYIICCWFAEAFVVTDIHYDPIGLPVIRDAYIPRLNITSESYRDIRLSVSRFSTIRVIVTDGISLDTITGEIYDRNMVPLATTGNPARRVYSLPPGETQTTVGIGSGSDLLSIYEKINVIRTGPLSGQMVLGGNWSDFNQTCIDGSVIWIPFDHETRSSDDTLRLHFRLTWDDTVETAYDDTPVIMGDFRDIAYLPHILELRLAEVLFSTGATIHPDHDIFIGCNREEILRRLPHVTFIIHPSSAEIVLRPEDYMHFDDDEDESCWYKFGINFENLHCSQINPLIIPNTNVHIVRSGIYVCDSGYL